MSDYIEQYKIFYTNGGYEDADPVVREKENIKQKLIETGSETLLDYGCGSCKQYTDHKLDKFWNLKELYCYDPGLKKFEKKPTKKYDAVINTDVLEHIPEQYVYDVISDIFSYANKLVYFSIATALARAILPNGENAHCTLKTHTEWVNIIRKYKPNNVITVIKTTGKMKGKKQPFDVSIL